MGLSSRRVDVLEDNLVKNTNRSCTQVQLRKVLRIWRCALLLSKPFSLAKTVQPIFFHLLLPRWSSLFFTFFCQNGLANFVSSSFAKMVQLILFQLLLPKWSSLFSFTFFAKMVQLIFFHLLCQNVLAYFVSLSLPKWSSLFCFTFMNSTLDSSGLSKRKRSKKFSSIGRSWAN